MPPSVQGGVQKPSSTACKCVSGMSPNVANHGDVSFAKGTKLVFGKPKSSIAFNCNWAQIVNSEFLSIVCPNQGLSWSKTMEKRVFIKEDRLFLFDALVLPHGNPTWGKPMPQQSFDSISIAFQMGFRMVLVLCMVMFHYFAWTFDSQRPAPNVESQRWELDEFMPKARVSTRRLAQATLPV